jgi:hypothetical protein
VALQPVAQLAFLLDAALQLLEGIAPGARLGQALLGAGLGLGRLAPLRLVLGQALLQFGDPAAPRLDLGIQVGGTRACRAARAAVIGLRDLAALGLQPAATLAEPLQGLVGMALVRLFDAQALLGLGQFAAQGLGRLFGSLQGASASGRRAAASAWRAVAPWARCAAFSSNSFQRASSRSSVSAWPRQWPSSPSSWARRDSTFWRRSRRWLSSDSSRATSALAANISFCAACRASLAA